MIRSYLISYTKVIYCKKQGESYDDENYHLVLCLISMLSGSVLRFVKDKIAPSSFLFLCNDLIVTLWYITKFSLSTKAEIDKYNMTMTWWFQLIHAANPINRIRLGGGCIIWMLLCDMWVWVFMHSWQKNLFASYINWLLFCWFHFNCLPDFLLTLWFQVCLHMFTLDFLNQVANGLEKDSMYVYCVILLAPCPHHLSHPSFHCYMNSKCEYIWLLQDMRPCSLNVIQPNSS